MKVMTGTRVWLPLILMLRIAPLGAAELSGEVGWGESVTLSTTLEAEVVRVTARPGELVKKGALLLQLDDDVARAQLAAAVAEVAHQTLLLREAGSELQRSEELYDRALLSDHDLDLARIGHAAANSSYQRASAGLAAAERTVAEIRLVAPFDGVVLRRHVQAGERVNGRLHSVPLYTLAAARDRVVRLVVMPAQAAGVKPGDELALRRGEQHYRGRVTALTHHGEPGSAPQVTVEILFSPEKGEAMTIGEVVRVSLP
ncbi:MAG: efflux RND transporter periplasmic adaptor subunit [Gammaproteobacteria bacterium]|nr:efflux RND transporter periplasmic adaptor subunit [Gammaproteobacteria bacterium]